MAKMRPKKSSKKTSRLVTQSISGLIRHIKLSVVLFFSGLGILANIVVFWPHISVEPSSVFDSRNPFESHFLIKNDGNLFCYNIDYSLLIGKVDYVDGYGINNLNLSRNESIPRLCPNDSSTVSLHGFLGLPPNYLQSAEIYITLSYRPNLIPISSKNFYRFKVVRLASGDYIWQKIYNDR